MLAVLLRVGLSACLLLEGELPCQSSVDPRRGQITVKKWGAHYDFRIRVEQHLPGGTVLLFHGAEWAPEFAHVAWLRDGSEMLLCNESG